MAHHASLTALLEAQPPSTPQREEDLAWLAGFWDGEGCVRIARTNTTSAYPIFTMSQAGGEGRELCERVQRLASVGGKVDGPFVKQAPSTDVYMFRANGYPRVAAMAIACWPWLSQTKKNQALTALSAFRAHGSRRRRKDDLTEAYFNAAISEHSRTTTRREELAWLAGFWDGEGCCSPLTAGNARNYPVFTLAQAGPENEALCRRVAATADIPACVSGPYVQRSLWTPQWKVRISGLENVQALAAMCWPWLSRTKRDQAARVLRAYHDDHPPRSQRTHCPKCSSPWMEPYIVHTPANGGWRCRVCRRKNPTAGRPDMWVSHAIEPNPRSLCGPMDQTI